LTCEPKDLCIALPVRARRTSAREHLPSYREPASRNPQAEPARTFYRECYSAYRFAFSRLVPRVRWASSFLLASALALQQALQPPGGQDARCVRPTSATRMILRTPVPRAFPARSAAFTAWTPHGVLGSVRLTRGPSASRHSRTLRRITDGHALPCPLNPIVSRRSVPRAWVLSPHGAH